VVLYVFHTVSATIPSSKSQTVMDMFGVFGGYSPMSGPAEGTPQENPFAKQSAVLLPEPEDEDEWEYEYSTTETEVCAIVLYHL
jgi:hypothetical protein